MTELLPGEKTCDWPLLCMRFETPCWHLITSYIRCILFNNFIHVFLAKNQQDISHCNATKQMQLTSGQVFHAYTLHTAMIVCPSAVCLMSETKVLLWLLFERPQMKTETSVSGPLSYSMHLGSDNHFPGSN